MPGARQRTATPMLGAVVLAAVLAAGCSRAERAKPQADPSSRRTTPSGTVVGFVGEYGSHTWLGIPYAQPPVGALRWRAPRPPAAWAGTLDATAFGVPCVQYASTLGGVADKRPGTPTGAEDCLYLNIWAPQVAPEAVPTGAGRLPVMVWIHGGGNTIGEGGFYNGGNLAATQHVVVVTLNYRLGPFGWLRHRGLRDAGTTELDRSGNFGTLDLVQALAWVRDNIAAFGGDPQNVTVLGESAGGTNVFSLLLARPAAGLFQRAIVESGGFNMSDVGRAENFVDDATPGDPNSSNEMLLRAVIGDGQATDRAAAKTRLAAMSDAEVGAYLRGKSATQILESYPPMPRVGMIRMPMVFRDGVVLPQEEPLLRLATADGYNRVPIMVGTNRDENKLFMFGDPEWVRRLFWIFPRLRDAAGYEVTAEHMSNMWKATGADQPAATITRAGGPPVFVYRFDWDEEPTIMGANLSTMLGAAHGFEIPFVFGHFNLGREGNVIWTAQNEAGRRALSSQMMSYWAAFAYRGAPGRGRTGLLPEWSAWDERSAQAPKYLILDTPAGGGVRMVPGALTRNGVLAAIEADPRLPTQRDRCALYRRVTLWSRALTEQEYLTIGKNGCAAYPLDTYPWQ